MGHTNVRQKILEDPHRAEHGRRHGNQCPDQRDRDEFAERLVPDQNVSPQRLPFPRYHQIIALATISAIGQIMVSGAHAEGVVFESTIADYKLGQIIASGEAIELPAGEHVKILSRDGEQIVIRETSIYDADNAEDDASSQPSAFEIAIWKKRRADIGGTRGDRFEQCLEAAEKDPTLEEADCEQLVGAGQAAPTFEISNTSVRSALRPSQDLRVKMVSDFNAITSCQLQRADQSAETTELRLGTHGKRTTRMLAGTPKHIPQRGVPAPKAPEQAGE